MTDLAPRRQLDIIHHEGYDPDRPGPYVPAIRVPYGVPVYISGLTAAPPYHEHPHRPETFDGIPADIEGQVELLFHHLDLSLAAAGCERRHIVVMNRFFTHVADDQNIVNAYQKEWFGGHIPTSTSVGIVQLATDPRLRLEINVIAVAEAPQRSSS